MTDNDTTDEAATINGEDSIDAPNNPTCPDGTIPVFTVHTEELFGHIHNDEERTQAADEYADKLRDQWADLDIDAGEPLVLPAEVDFRLERPEE